MMEDATPAHANFFSCSSKRMDVEVKQHLMRTKFGAEVPAGTTVSHLPAIKRMPRQMETRNIRI